MLCVPPTGSLHGQALMDFQWSCQSMSVWTKSQLSRMLRSKQVCLVRAIAEPIECCDTGKHQSLAPCVCARFACMHQQIRMHLNGNVLAVLVLTDSDVGCDAHSKAPAHRALQQSTTLLHIMHRPCPVSLACHLPYGPKGLPYWQVRLPAVHCNTGHHVAICIVSDAMMRLRNRDFRSYRVPIQ